MAKEMTIQNGKDYLKVVLVKKIAEKTGFTKRYIYRILAEQPDHEITIEYMTAREGLVQAVKNAVPFN